MFYEFLGILADIVFFALSIYVDVRYVKLFLKPKKQNSVKLKLLCAAGIVVNWIIYHFIPVTFLIIFSAFMSILLIAIIYYKGGLLEKMLVVGLKMALSIAAEGLVWRFLVWVNGENFNEALGGLLSNLLLLVMAVTLERFIRIDKEVRLSNGSYINMITVSVGGAVLAEILTDMSGVSHQVVIFGLCIIGIMNMGTYYMYERVYDAYREKIKKTVLEKRILMYQNQFEIIHAFKQDMKQLRHDIKNHFLLLEGYLQKEKYKEAQEYIGQLAQKSISSKEYINTGNDELDIIMNYHLERAEYLHCRTDVKVEVPNERFMSDFDLNMLLSNLMDNALEALEKTQDRVLTVRIKYIKKVLYVSVYNSYGDRLKNYGNKFITTKAEKEEHGIGMTCIQSIVDKYQGEMTIQTTEDMFKSDIIMYV